MQSGLASSRNTALAAVVSLFAWTKRMVVTAYAPPTSAARQVQARRASGTMTSTATAATAPRRPATCQPVKAHSLNAAPPVENSVAAARIRRRDAA